MNATQLRNVNVLARLGLAQIAAQPEKYNALTIAEVAVGLDACEKHAAELARAEESVAKAKADAMPAEAPKV